MDKKHFSFTQGESGVGGRLALQQVTVDPVGCFAADCEPQFDSVFIAAALQWFICKTIKNINCTYMTAVSTDSIFVIQHVMGNNNCLRHVHC